MVPDERLQALADLVHPNKVIPTVIEFVDIAGLVKGASTGEGLGNQFLANIREVDAIIHVVRCFEDEQVVHVAGQVDPVFDKEVIDHELQCKDLETVRKQLQKNEKIAKSGNADAKEIVRLLKTFETALAQGNAARHVAVKEEDIPMVCSWQLLTIKPVIYITNVDEAAIKIGTNDYVKQLKNVVQKENATIVVICAELESQISELPPEEKKPFLETYGLETTGLSQLIRMAYHLLDLITYFTVGPQEVRAWTIKRNTKAPQAAGVIHSDFERGFIKAEVIKLADYKHYKNELACKEAGKMAIEGKNYIVQDGDIMHFRCNT